MDALTIFHAYQKAEFWKRYACNQRGSSRGIAVENDPNARIYQHADRQSKKFSAKIETALSTRAMAQTEMG